jgi:FAD/FMN-containing dehydrogenase
LTIDNLLGVAVVRADGTLVTASAAERPDLFWAVRGGGGNFGIVTSFLFRTQPVHTVVAGPMFWALDDAGDMLRWYRDFMPAAPRELYGFAAIQNVPPAPPFPEELHLRTVCGVVWCFTGPAERADDALRPARRFKRPLWEQIAPVPFPTLQAMFDPLLPPGLQWYWKGDFVRDLPDAAIERHVEFGSRLPSPLSQMHLYPIDGRVHEVGRNETAFAYRDVSWSMVIAGIDTDPANAERITAWAKDYWGALHPYSAGGAYSNFMMAEGEEGQDRVRATYGDNYARLVEVKTKYDPENFFRLNQNIRPAR